MIKTGCCYRRYDDGSATTQYLYVIKEETYFGNVMFSALSICCNFDSNWSISGEFLLPSEFVGEEISEEQFKKKYDAAYDVICKQKRFV